VGSGAGAEGHASMQGMRLGSYELIRRLGEGGMAQVYLARDVRLGREVAVKVLDRRLAERTGFRERFLREAKLAAALDHPNIVQLYDFGEEGSDLYLVMPFMTGGSLQDKLSQTPFSVNDVVNYAMQIADALEYAHGQGVIHRDVKPANIMLHADGRVLLGDFGLAKIFDGAARPAVRDGRPDAGTPEYMAPEQIKGQTDARSDLYGLGVVMYLLLTGRLPFSGPSSNSVMEGHLYRLAAPPRQLNPKVTPAVDEVVQKALAKDPRYRFQSAREMSGALVTALVSGDAEPFPFAPSSAPSLSGPSPFSPQHISEPVRPISDHSFGRPSQFGARPSGPDAGSTSLLPSLDVPMAPSRPPAAYGPMGQGNSGGGQIPSDFPYPSENPSAITGGYAYGQMGQLAHATNLPIGAPIGAPPIDPINSMGPMSPAAGRIASRPRTAYSNPPAPLSDLANAFDTPLRRSSQPPTQARPLSLDAEEAGHGGRSLRFWLVIGTLALILIAAAGLLLYRVL
jgi:serine/threonine protein kinase